MINKLIAKKILEDHQKRGFNVNPSVFSQVESATNIFEFSLDNQEAFLNLIWHSIDASRILTPQNAPRTLKDVATRMIDNNFTFKGFSSKEYSGHYSPEWFKFCPKYYEDFDFKKFGSIILNCPKPEENKQSPNGSFYISDGSHKSLVLAYKILRQKIEFQQIHCLLFFPRSN